MFETAWQEEEVGKGARPESSSISQSLNYGAPLDFMIRYKCAGLVGDLVRREEIEKMEGKMTNK